MQIKQKMLSLHTKKNKELINALEVMDICNIFPTAQSVEAIFLFHYKQANNT